MGFPTNIAINNEKVYVSLDRAGCLSVFDLNGYFATK